ncbi:kinesin-like protein KIF23 isoform X2 [Solenopsis invicta]|nr:kinesin-like protein KIF23 isoform X2 [Solenopsis invicta]
MRFLETRIPRRELLQDSVREKQNHFRNILVELENENVSLRYANDEQKKMIAVLEGRIYKLQNHIDGLLYKLNNACDAMRSIQHELKDKDRQLKEHTLEKQKIIQRCNDKIRVETDRMTEAMETKLREQHEQLTRCIKKKDDKLRLVGHILSEDMSNNVTLTPPIASSSKIETMDKATLTIAKEESPTVTPINLQASSTCEQICQTSSCAKTIPNNDGKITERSSLSLSKDSKMTFVDSQISDSQNQIHQTLFCATGNSNNSQKKVAKEPILTIVREFSTPLDSKIKIEESNPSTPVDFLSSSTNVTTDTTIVTKSKLNFKVPVVNPRYQRVQNADSWIDHRPPGIVPTGTILQPQMQPRKLTIRKLTKPKDFVARSSRYCLVSQEQDTDGELETKLYKADVLPTCGGGAQIIFNDIECLKQISPTTAKHNKQIKTGK